jgi:glucose/arabinose dehydrogenase
VCLFAPLAILSFESKGRAGEPRALALPSGFTQDVIASGLSFPTAFANLPDGRILIAEKAGVVRIYKNGAVLGTPFIDIRDRVNDYSDHGLLGLTIDPNFAQNGLVYLLYTYENDRNDYTGPRRGAWRAIRRRVIRLRRAARRCSSAPPWAAPARISLRAPTASPRTPRPTPWATSGSPPTAASS